MPWGSVVACIPLLIAAHDAQELPIEIGDQTPLLPGRQRRHASQGRVSAWLPTGVGGSSAERGARGA